MTRLIMYKKKDNNTEQKSKNLKRFGIISAVIFTLIVLLSLTYIKSCNDVNCNNVFVQSIHVIILTSGIIGLGYCILILKSFEVKTDPIVEREYKEIIKDLNDDNRKYDSN